MWKKNNPNIEMKDSLKKPNGFTLIEMMVAVAIVGLLAAVAIPLVRSYALDSRISEAIGNVQGLLESEEGFFVRFRRYTVSLDWCPANIPATAGRTQAWPTPVNDLMPCGGDAAQRREWALLGWRPDQTLYFRYRVFSAYGVDPNDANRIILRFHPTQGTEPTGMNPAMRSADGYVANRATTFGINWNSEVPLPANINDMRPWCAVEAEADTDRDNQPVFIRANVINHQYLRVPNPRMPAPANTKTW